MTLSPTEDESFIDGLVNNTAQLVQSLERAGRYELAAAAGEIGAEFEEVRLLVEQLLVDVDDVPQPSAVRTVTGASTGSAATFAVPLANTVVAAGAATQALRNQVHATMAAVQNTLIELTASNAEAHKALSGLASEVAAADSTAGVTPGVAPGVAPGVEASAPAAADTAAPGNEMRG